MLLPSVESFQCGTGLEKNRSLTNSFLVTNANIWSVGYDMGCFIGLAMWATTHCQVVRFNYSQKRWGKEWL